MSPHVRVGLPRRARAQSIGPLQRGSPRHCRNCSHAFAIGCLPQSPRRRNGLTADDVACRLNKSKGEIRQSGARGNNTVKSWGSVRAGPFLLTCVDTWRQWKTICCHDI